jgi:outer membrane protein assembly factor BamB
MKSKKLLILISMLVIGALLSGCSGRAIGATSWPGVSVDGNTIFVAYNTEVYAVNEADGSPVWRYPEEPNARRTFFAAPAYAEGLLVVGDYSNQLTGLSPDTASVKWSFTDAKSRYVGSPLIAGDTILAPNADYTLYALDLQGALKWKFKARQALWSQPVTDGEKVYLASMDHYLYGLSLADGSLLWENDLGGAMVSKPTFADGVLYTGTVGSEVVAVDAASGKELWRFSASSEVWAQPVVAEGGVFFGDLRGNLYGLDAKTGAQVWKIENAGQVIGSAGVISDGVVFATEESGIKAYSFDGNPLWSLQVNGKLYSGPVVTSQYILVGVNDGDAILIAIDFGGNQRWSYQPVKK